MILGENPNYAITAKNGRFTIVQANPLFEVTADTVTDDLDPAAAVLHRSDESIPGTLKLDETALEYDTKTYHWTFTPDDTKNYTTQKGVVIITVTGHVWGEPTYTWSADHSTCTATRVCANNPEHIDTETVNSTCDTTAAFCTVASTATYYAEFTKEAFQKQTETVTGTALGHSYGEPEWHWSPRGEASATFVCNRCGNTETIDAETRQVNALNSLTIAAAVQFDGHTFTDSFVVYGNTQPTKAPFPMYIPSVIITKPEEKPAEPETPKEQTPAAPAAPEPAKQPTQPEVKTPLWKQFKDVKADGWYLEYIEYMLENKLMTGTASDKFDPDAATDRATVVTVLYRLEGEPEVIDAEGFDDVPEDSWYAKAVAWAHANEIVLGYGERKFGPTDTVTREQLAAILYRYAQYKKYSTTKSASLTKFKDAKDIEDWTQKAMQWAVGESFLSGRTADTLAPKGDVSRAETAAVIVRFTERYGK